MKEISNKDKSETFLKRIFKYFNSLLVIDKSIDLILIFVGLLAALGVESYQKSIQKEERYIDMIARLHTEIQLNDYNLNSYESSVSGFFSISEAILELTKLGGHEYYDGINELIKLENEPLEIKVYQSISSEDFLNRTLYSDIIHLYDLYKKLGDEMNIPRNELAKYNYNFYRLFVKNSYEYNDQLNEYIEINYLYQSITKSLPALQNIITDIQTTSERLLSSLEFELEKYNSNSDESKSLSDLHLLSTYAGANGKHHEAVNFSHAGIERLGNISFDTSSQGNIELLNYYGRFNYDAFMAKVAIFKEGDTITYSKADIFHHLVEWHHSNYDNDLSIIGYLEYYYFIEKDFEQFLKYLNKSIEQYPDCTELSHYISTYVDFTDELQLIKMLEKSVPDGIDWHEWLSGIKLYE